MLEVFTDYLSRIENPQNRARTEAVLNWVAEQFPQMKPRIAWNQPMFTDHGTYIIGFSVSKKHLAVAPEGKGMEQFREELQRSGYDCGKMLARIRWEQPVDYALLKRMIAFNIADKADCVGFWRK